MNGNWIRLTGMMLAAVTLLTVGSRDLSAQVNLTGTWAMEVTTEAGGTTTPTLTLQQNGDRLTGHYSSETLGEADITGTVTGNQIAFGFQADLQGQAVPVAYAATLDANGEMSGTIDIAGGLATGTFKARKTGE